jgi:hypothetical protein
MEDKRWISKLGTVTYMLGETVIDNIAKKVAEEPVPQHIIDEAVADASRERTKELRQMEMYDDEWMNWSGLR